MKMRLERCASALGVLVDTDHLVSSELGDAGVGLLMGLDSAQLGDGPRNAVVWLIGLYGRGYSLL